MLGLTQNTEFGQRNTYDNTIQSMNQQGDLHRCKFMFREQFSSSETTARKLIFPTHTQTIFPIMSPFLYVFVPFKNILGPPPPP